MTIPSTNESICAIARRITQERWKTEKAAVLVTQEAFIKGLVGDAFVLNEDGSYQICGRRWHYFSGYTFATTEQGRNPHIAMFDKWKGLRLSGASIRDLDGLGGELIRADQQVEAYEKEYPDTLWGRIKLWWIKDGWFPS